MRQAHFRFAPIPVIPSVGRGTRKRTFARLSSKYPLSTHGRHTRVLTVSRILSTDC